MAGERTSPACVEIFSEADSKLQRQSLDFSITSTAETTTSQYRTHDEDHDSGCYSEDGIDGPRRDDDTGTGNSGSDDDDRQNAVYNKHVVSHVEPGSALTLKRFIA